MSASEPASPARGGVVATAAVVIAYGVAMAFLESAVVVYLQRALGIETGAIFPLRDPAGVGDLAVIEVGREAATLVMLVAVGWIAGRSWLERLAWTAVAFGTWDILYYAWLWVFVGWPPSLATWDLLFLIPVPWAGPVWSPVAVSVALIGFGLAAAGIGGGAIVVVAFCWNAPLLVDGGTPADFPWPVFAAGMALAAGGAATALRPRPTGGTARPDEGGTR